MTCIAIRPLRHKLWVWKRHFPTNAYLSVCPKHHNILFNQKSHIYIYKLFMTSPVYILTVYFFHFRWWISTWNTWGWWNISWSRAGMYSSKRFFGTLKPKLHAILSWRHCRWKKQYGRSVVVKSQLILIKSQFMLYFILPVYSLNFHMHKGHQ